MILKKELISKIAKLTDSSVPYIKILINKKIKNLLKKDYSTKYLIGFYCCCRKQVPLCPYLYIAILNNNTYELMPELAHLLEGPAVHIKSYISCKGLN